ncbi:MAG: aldo/keto reductase [Opitutae bacterium]|nr:aldo/keto reductase [Opitutae bacterium]
MSYDPCYSPNKLRYSSKMQYERCGLSGLKLPLITLGLWHNFGASHSLEKQSSLIKYAFDCGITHFDLANNYGPPPGKAEENFGQILKNDLSRYRDELIITTKAGYQMWDGPYGDGGSKKYLISSLDQSLKRMHLDYVDIFYHHRPDPETPLDESMAALDSIVRSGKALYIGLSNYNSEDGLKALKILKDLGTPCLIHQLRYNLLDREAEHSTLVDFHNQGVGSIAFSPLAQGLLSDRYLKNIPDDSRAGNKASPFLDHESVNANIKKIKKLNEIAKARNQTLAQMALAWCLRRPEVTSVLIGASSNDQIKENLKSLGNLNFSEADIKVINTLTLEV